MAVLYHHVHPSPIIHHHLLAPDNSDNYGVNIIRSALDLPTHHTPPVDKRIDIDSHNFDNQNSTATILIQKQTAHLSKSMKWLSLLSIFPSLALAFQQVAPVHRYKTSLNFFPANFDRAEQCASSYDTCDIEELEGLTDGAQT